MHRCNVCNYATSNITHYKKHLLTQKHQKNSKVNILTDKLNEHNKLKDEIKTELKTEIKTDMEKIKNDVSIAIRKQNVFNKSVMTILTREYNKNPTLTKIDKDEFIKELELEYDSKIDDEKFILQHKIISDFKHKRLFDTVAKLILKFVKKDDLKFQSVFNTDISRCTYATKIEKAWLNDKLGLKLREIILIPAIEYIIDSLQPLREEVEKQLFINKKNPSVERSDFIMNNSHYLMEVNYTLVKKRTHDQILYKISPLLHLDTQFLILED
jgi:hypothetical protein